MDVQQARKDFIARMKTTWTDRLVFLDESGCNISMAKSHGWAPRGARLHDHKPANWGDNLSTIGAIRCSGTVCQQTVRGAVDTPKFIGFIRERLCPRLRPGDIVVLDNLKPHKHPLVRELVHDAGAELLLMPPYSPDLNPIELCWSWVKRRVKELAARNVDNVRAAIRSAFRAIPRSFFGSWYEHCGYRVQSTRSSV